MPIASSVLLLAAATSLSAGEAAGRVRAANARLMEMMHAYYPPSAWEQALEQLRTAGAAARAEGDLNAAYEADLARLRHLFRIPGRQAEAGRLAEALLSDPSLPSPAARAIYILRAEQYAVRGDEASIRRLIERFTASPHFDGRGFEYRGGHGPQDPLVVRRPHARDGGSLTVTAMDRILRTARLAPGRPCPPFALHDRQGRTWSEADLAGKVVLLDFWVTAWEPWRRELPNLQALYRRYAPHGFEILGINLERDPRAGYRMLERLRAPWPQLQEGSAFAARLGLFGEVTNVLIDRQGLIVGRNLYGAALASAIRRHVFVE